MQQARQLYQTVGNQARIGARLTDIATIYKEQQQYSQALDYYQQALTIFRALNERSVQANTQSNIANIYEKQKQYPQALNHYQQALTIFRTLGNQSAQANALLNIGNIYNQQKQYPQALNNYQQALTLFRSIQDHTGEAATLGIMGYAYLDQNQYAQARAAFQQQLELARQANNRTDEVYALSGIRATYTIHAQQLFQSGAYAEVIAEAQQAVQPSQQALALVDTAKLPPELVKIVILNLESTYVFQGNAFNHQREYPQAIAAFRQSLTLLQENRSRLPEHDWLQAQSNILSVLASAYNDNGQYTEALSTYQQAVQVAAQLNDTADQIQQLQFVATAYRQLGNFDKALEASQQAVAIAREKLPDDKRVVIGALISLAQAYDAFGRYTDSLATYQQALTIAKTTENINIQSALLNNIGNVYLNQGQYLQALQYLQQVRSMAACSIERLKTNMAEAFPKFCQFLLTQDASTQRQCLESAETRTATTLNNLGQVYGDLGRYADALAAYQQVLAIAQQYKLLKQQMFTLNNIGTLYEVKGEYAKALEALRQALQIAVNTKSRPRQAGALDNIANVYNDQGQYPKALDYYQQSLALAREIHAPNIEATALNNIGQLYLNLGNYTEALTFLQQSSELSQKLGVSNSVDLSNIANVYIAQGRNAQALEKLQQALNLAQTSGDREQESFVLRSMVAVYESQANYAKALEVQQQVLKIQQEIGARPLEIGSLIQLGRLYHDLGDYNKALEFHQQALNLSREIGSRLNEMIAIANMGRAYLYQKQYNKALASYQQNLSIAREMGDVSSESNYLFSIGRVYEKQGQSEPAIANNQQALTIVRQIGARSLEGLVLNSVGAAYANQGKFPEALTTLQQALAIHRQIQAPEAEAEALARIGKVLAQTNQPELAIIWYKQSVNTYEAIRGNLRGLPQKQQQSYGETIADTYRQLAKLLLQQDRVMEAQEVLDLLKLQELEDYLRNVRGNAKTQQGLEFWQAEQQVLNLYDQWIKQNSNANFEAFVKSPDVTALVQQLQRTARGQNLNPEQLARLQDNLQSIDHAALLYPLILDDRLELVLVTPNSLVRQTVKVDRVQLNQAIANFRSDLTDPSSNPLPDAQQLYQWLLQPLEADLKQAQIQTILYAADGQLRYIPLAALHDGKQWLIQRFTLDHITAASLTNFNRQESRPLQVLAAAYSNPQLSYQFPIGKEQFNFTGLKFAGVEVETIAKEVPNTTTFFNKNFSRANIEPRLDQYSIVHLATHSEFVSGSPYQSFILFGSGERVTLADIDRWKLPHVDLVVLSACRTATSGKLGNGEEILGFGYQIQRTGAEAAIASLWSVSDGGTQALMDAFYAGLHTGKISKAEALRQAQIALITGNYKALGEQRGLGVEQRVEDSLPSVVSVSEAAQNALRLSHPYYWAPFILIGNGL